jgi:hypothetical protein
LHRLYDEYGERLLELNVRSFLQARGKVNQGIRDTLKDDPASFFAYNNGLSAVAEEVEVLQGKSGPALAKIRGLQIVNGGQTTASIHRAKKKDGVMLDQVFVQMKLIVVPAESLESVVPRISRNANSQNKVNDADFSANDPYHRRVEELSRSTWAPGQKTQWFYERARGQYQVAKAKAPTGFETRYPPRMMFTKTDLASSENSWDQKPHIVSRGGQKNFLEFMLENEEEHVPDRVAGIAETDFQGIVARLILFRRAQAVARQLAFPAYRANIVTYSVAYLSVRVPKAIDFDRLWREQDVPPALAEAIRSVEKVVDREIKSSAGARNVTEWCKKEECWKHIRALSIPLPKTFWAKGGSRPTAETAAEATEPSTSAPVATDVVVSALVTATGRAAELIDHRQMGGDLWVVGDTNLRSAMVTLARRGHAFVFLPKGDDVTRGRPAWRLRR